jgi:hypothetical protein
VHLEARALLSSVLDGGREVLLDLVAYLVDRLLLFLSCREGESIRNAIGALCRV